MQIEIAMPKIFIDFQDENVFRAHVKKLLKDNLKVKYDTEKKGVEIDFDKSLTALSELTTILLFAGENMFIMSKLIDKLSDLGKALESKYGPEQSYEIIQLFNTFVMNDVFDRLQTNNEILKNL